MTAKDKQEVLEWQAAHKAKDPKTRQSYYDDFVEELMHENEEMRAELARHHQDFGKMRDILNKTFAELIEIRYQPDDARGRAKLESGYLTVCLSLGDIRNIVG